MTRSSSSTDLSRDVVGQLFSQPGVLATAAVFLGLMALTPLPKLPLLTLGSSLGAGAFVLSSRREDERRREPEGDDREAGAVRTHSRARSAEASGVRPAVRSQIDGLVVDCGGRPTGASADSASERMEDLLHVDPLELEIGFRLIGLADPTRGGDLLEPAQDGAAARGA